MGLFDLPSPLLGWLDALLARALPALARLIVWGAAGSIVSMLLFRALSPQTRIAELKRGTRNARVALDAHDGSLGEAWPQMREMLELSFLQVALVLGPALLASLPVLCLIVWLSNAFGPVMPRTVNSAQLSVQPPGLDARWIQGTRGAAIELRNDRNELIDTIAVSGTTTVLHKRKWWNALVANPGGYLDDNAPAERIDIVLPARELVSFGPHWLRSWELIFFVALVAFSVALKLGLRIE